MRPPAPQAPEEDPVTAREEPTATVVWVQEGPVCVRVEYLPPQVRCHACQCMACRVHQPDPAVLYY